MVKNNIDINALGSDNIRVKNLAELDFKLSSYKFNTTSFQLEVSGDAKIEAAMDVDAIKKQVAESPLINSSAVLSLIPGASRAEVNFKPFWASFLPKGLNFASRPDHIDIIITSR